MAKLIVRHTRESDIEALIELQRRVYPDIEPWTRDRVLHQLDVFLQGQVVVLYDDRLVGCASSLIVRWDDWLTEHTWSEITASGTFEHHVPMGRTLYGAEVFVDPKLRGQRVGHALYDARRKICKRLNLKRIIACGRLPGYHKVAGDMSVDTYVRRVIWGDLKDPVLGFQLREQFDFCGVIENYLPQDTESCGHASLIVWLNPRYDAEKPTMISEGDVL